ncbi:hypothetical protein KW805_01430 [Candidatus Pacearchaeota archaeon]|nr:hypothetical protein [Candidatus Pacearchaeota archaeon]
MADTQIIGDKEYFIIPLSKNPSTLIEKDGLFYVAHTLLVCKGVKEAIMRADECSPLELGVDIVETAHNVKLAIDSESSYYITYKNMMRDCRELARISSHDYFDIEFGTIYTLGQRGIGKFKPRLFRKLVNN